MRKLFQWHNLTIMLILFSLCLSCGCRQNSTSSTTTATSPDERLAGLWTTAKSRQTITLDADGKPAGEIPVGIWYRFDPSGAYYRVARYMTFAIGGVAVEEGRYRTANGEIALFQNTESFFPDEGSPQKPKYRETIADSNLIYQLKGEGSDMVLLLKAGPEQPEVEYFQLK